MNMFTPDILLGWQLAPLFAFDFWSALVPIITVILLVLSQVLGGKDKQQQARRAAEQRRRAQPQPGEQAGGGGDPVQKEIDEFLRRAGQNEPPANEQQQRQQREQQQREQQQRENQRRAEEERRRRQAANQPELRRRNYDPMAEDSTHYQRQRPTQPQGRSPQQPEPEVVEAIVVVEEPVRESLADRKLPATNRPKSVGIGSEFYDSVDAHTAKLDQGAEHSYDIFGALDNPLDVGSKASDEAASPGDLQGIDFASAVVGIFQDPVRAKEAILAREVLERPDFDRW